MDISGNEKPNHAPYVLITPVKDEEALIGETIASVTSQTLKPLRWVIVNDGSGDRTGQIVQCAAEKHPWIKLINLAPRSGRNFAAVVRATEIGIQQAATLDYGYIGLLDADVRFKPDYFAEIIARFEKNPMLGLGGGMVVDYGQAIGKKPRNRQDIPGASQFFRKECFEKIGGLHAIPEGGWDALTCANARMAGYQTILFDDLVLDHLKPRNIGEGGRFKRIWQMGVRDYALGYHPLFEIFKCIDRIKDTPVALGSMIWFTGYFWSALMRRPRSIPDELLRFIHNEQKSRIKHLFTR